MSHLKPQFDASRFEEVKLVYYNKVKAAERPTISEPHDAFHILIRHWDHAQINLIEECKVLLLDNKNRLMSIAQVSKGGMTNTAVDPRVIFATALKRRAHAMILAHNHPSGGLDPSKSDLKLTETIDQIGKMLKIRLLDHLIITQEGFRSISTDAQGSMSL